MKILLLAVFLSLLSFGLAIAADDASPPNAASAPAQAPAPEATPAPISSTPATVAAPVAASPSAPAATSTPAATTPKSVKHKKKIKPTAEQDNVTVDPALLSAQDTADVARIEEYLNNLKSISAGFMQIDDQGGMMHGEIKIQRPGKMRVTYDPPSKDFIIADGSNVHIWNDDLKEQTNVDESSSLAEFILRDPVKLSGDVTVKKFERFPAKLELTLMATKDPAAGQLTLVFEDHPLILRQWRVLDPQGHTTGVNLENEQEGVSFKENIFSFVPPNFGKNRNSQIPE